jgi:hypothetical protein
MTVFHWANRLFWSRVLKNQQIPFYNRCFASADLKLKSINTQIARLEKDKSEYFKVIQANIYIS